MNLKPLELQSKLLILKFQPNLLLQRFRIHYKFIEYSSVFQYQFLNMAFCRSYMHVFVMAKLFFPQRLQDKIYAFQWPTKKKTVKMGCSLSAALPLL